MWGFKYKSISLISGPQEEKLIKLSPPNFTTRRTTTPISLKDFPGSLSNIKGCLDGEWICPFEKNTQKRLCGQDTGCRHANFLQTKLPGGLCMGITDIHLFTEQPASVGTVLHPGDKMDLKY